MNFSSKENGNCEVRVRAQVMMRDDSTGGWVPMGGGGLSNVSVRKRKLLHEEVDQPCRHEYLIHGKRISDNSIDVGEVVLSCTIKKDFEYNKVMPTFHHWKTGNKKFGLTFQTAADARAFDKGVRSAIQDLLDANTVACPHKHFKENKRKGISETSPLHQYNLDVGDDDVFMQLDLPVDKRYEPLSPAGSSSGRSPSPLEVLDPTAPASSTKSLSPPPLPPLGVSVTSMPLPLPPTTTSSGSAEYVCMVADPAENPLHYPPRTRYLLEQYGHAGEKTHFILPDAVGSPKSLETTISCMDDDTEYPYVKFPRREPPHEYSYPKLVDTYSAIDECKMSSSTKSSFRRKPEVPPLRKSNSGTGSDPGKIVVGSGSSCGSTSHFESSSLSCSGDGKGRHHDGCCKPLLPSLDKPKSGLKNNSGLQTCVHCRKTFTFDNNRVGMCSYAPADFARQGIEAATCLRCAECLLYHCMSDAEGDYVHPCDCTNRDGHWARRWIGLSLLSILVPCLCCYVPLMACYKCGAACHLCGGRHEAS